MLNFDSQPSSLRESLFLAGLFLAGLEGPRTPIPHNPKFLRVSKTVEKVLQSLESMRRFEDNYFMGGRGNLFDSLMVVCTSYWATGELDLERELKSACERAMSDLDPGVLEGFLRDAVRGLDAKELRANVRRHVRAYHASHSLDEFFAYQFYSAKFFFDKAKNETESLYEYYGFPKETYGYIKREISFQPEYRQSFISVLSYFSQILESKHPELDAVVSLEQEGNLVRLTIRTEEGQVEIVEQELKEYGLVVTRQVEPEAYMSSSRDALMLRNKLDLAEMEVKTVTRILESERGQFSARVASLESQMERMGKLLEGANRQSTHLTEVLADLSKFQMKSNLEAFQSLLQVMERGIEEQDKEKVTSYLREIRNCEPNLFNRIHEGFLKASLTSAVGNMLYGWAVAVASTPH